MARTLRALMPAFIGYWLPNEHMSERACSQQLLLKHFLQYLCGALPPELIQGRTQVRLCCA